MRRSDAAVPARRAMHAHTNGSRLLLAGAQQLQHAGWLSACCRLLRQLCWFVKVAVGNGGPAHHNFSPPAHAYSALRWDVPGSRQVIRQITHRSWRAAANQIGRLHLHLWLHAPRCGRGPEQRHFACRPLPCSATLFDTTGWAGINGTIGLDGSSHPVLQAFQTGPNAAGYSITKLSVLMNNTMGGTCTTCQISWSLWVSRHGGRARRAHNPPAWHAASSSARGIRQHARRQQPVAV